MKKNDTLLMLWCAAGLTLIAGIWLTIHSLNGLGRTREILSRKMEDATELARLRVQATYYKSLLESHAQVPATPIRFETLVRDTLPGQAMRLLTTDTSPSGPGWTARKVSVEMNDIGGVDLGRLLDAGAATKPPWTLLECTLFASSTPGRIAKATLVMGSTERDAAGH